MGNMTDLQWKILETYYIHLVVNDLNKVRAYSITMKEFSAHPKDLLWLAEQINLDPKFYKGTEDDN